MRLELSGRGASRRGDIRKLRDELIKSRHAIFDSGGFRLGKGNLLLETKQARLAFDEERRSAVLGSVKRTLRAGHAMRTLVEEIVRAVAVPEIVEAPGLPARDGGMDRVSIDQDVDGAEVALEIVRIRVGARQFRRRQARVVLRRLRRRME